MENGNGSWQPWTGWVPTREEMAEQDGSKAGAPRVHPNGWYRLEYPSGRTEVCHVREIRFLDHWRVETYSAGEEGPVYDHGYYLPRMRPITEAKALAWFAAQGVTPPRMDPEEKSREEGPATEAQQASWHEEHA
jgi:hypothetical protein